MNLKNSFNNLKNLRILLVEDDALIRDSLGMVFKSRGCHFIACESAEKALPVLDSDGFDIIISDFKLPGTDGLAFLKSAAAISPQSIKILITAFHEKGIVAEAFRCGIHDFIEKPFSPRKLIAAVSQLTAGHQPASISGACA